MTLCAYLASRWSAFFRDGLKKPAGLFLPPVIADLDGDGQRSIVGSWDGCVHAWRSDGSILPGWPKPTGHFVWSTPVVKDLNGDGILEVSWSPARFISGARTVPVPGWPQKIGGYSVSGSRRGSDDVASEVIVGRNNSTPG